MTTGERLEQEVSARGAAYVFLALDLAAFVEPAARDTLLNLRGRKEFDEFLDRFDPQDARFERAHHYKRVEQRGYELGVFNRVLAEDNFAPTYRLVKERVKFPPELMNNVQFKDKFLTVWKKWEFWLRLSSNGIITIILKLDIPKPRELIFLSRDVMGLQGNFDMESARDKLNELRAAEPSGANSERIESILQFMAWVRRHAMVDIERESPAVVWQMAVEVVRQFVDACRGRLVNISQSLPFELKLKGEPERGGNGSLREQYTVFYFDEMGHYNWSTRQRRLLPPHEVLDGDYARTITGLLEGILIRGKRDYFYPTHNMNCVRDIVARNKSSWQNELCVLSDRSAIIYPHMSKQSRQVIFSSHQIDYAQYWECVLRALEFGVETRLLVHLAKQMTSSYLAEALPVLHKNGATPRDNLQRFDFQAANAARLLAHLRTITAPHIIAQASYSVNKLELFMVETGIPDILKHAEMNLNHLKILVDNSHDTHLQSQSRFLNELTLVISVIVGGLTFGLGILMLPSFILDWEEERQGFLATRWYYPYLSYTGEILVIILLFLGVVMFVVAALTLAGRALGRRIDLRPRRISSRPEGQSEP